MPFTVRGILDGLRKYLSLALELFQGGKKYSFTDDMMAAHAGTCTMPGTWASSGRTLPVTHAEQREAPGTGDWRQD